MSKFVYLLVRLDEEGETVVRAYESQTDATEVVNTLAELLPGVSEKTKLQKVPLIVQKKRKRNYPEDFEAWWKAQGDDVKGDGTKASWFEHWQETRQ